MHGSAEVLARMLIAGGVLLQLLVEAAGMVLAEGIALDFLRGCSKLLA